MRHGSAYGAAARVEAPDQIYGPGIGSNYQAQGLKPSKHFRFDMWHDATIGEAGDPAVMPQIEAIFFDGAATQNFASEAERAAYCDLWLGRYLRHCPQQFLVASDPGNDVVGYLAGALFSKQEPLPGPDYYDGFPGALIEAYPAHLHVNVRHDHHGRNVGSTAARSLPRDLP